MNPNAPQQPVQPQAPQPPMPPQQPVQPQAPLPPQQPVTPQQPIGQPYVPPTPPKKSKTWLWVTLGIVGALLLVLVIISIIAYPAIQARATARSFMEAVKTHNAEDLQKTSGETFDSYLERSHFGLKNASFDIKDSTKKDVGYVVNFTVTGSDIIRNASVVVKDNKVTTFNLNTGGGTASANTPTSQPATATACLTSADLKANGFTYIDDKALQGNRTYLQMLFFSPDSTAFRSESIANTTLNKIASLYRGTNTKDYTFAVRGSVYEPTKTTEGADLANRRSTEIKNRLVGKGIPANKVTVDTPVNGAASAEAARNITVFLSASSACRSGATSSTGVGR